MRHTLCSILLCSALVGGALAGPAPCEEPDPRISELRTDQPGIDYDEYFELAGTSGLSLDGLTYLVIGDGAGASGVVEAVIGLDGLAIPDDGYFLAAEDSFTLASRDFTTNLAFENDDNVTHLLVRGFTGAVGQDLDADDDGVLDTTPWTELVDLIALVKEENPPTGTEFHYGPPAVGPDGSSAPEHAIYCFHGWKVGEATLGVDDTPGTAGCCLTLDCYYAGVDLTSRDSTRQTLHEAIEDHERVSFEGEGSWEVLELADEWPRDGSTILDLYRNQTYEKEVGRGTDYQREHTWPQSYGIPKDSGTGRMPRSDLHALFLADASYNGSRSNLPFDECSPSCLEHPTVTNHGQGGEGGPYPGDSNWRTGEGTTGSWEVWRGALGGRRGDVARALFYMDVRYDGSDHRDGSLEPELVLTDDRSMLFSDTVNTKDTGYMGMLETLLRWHEEDPPDDLEAWRQEVISAVQGNRNPFVDHPDWVRCVYVEDCGIFADGFESGNSSAWSTVFSE